MESQMEAKEAKEAKMELSWKQRDPSNPRLTPKIESK